MNDESHDDELDLGVEKAPTPWKKILIIVAGVLLLVGAGVGVTYFLLAPQDDEKSEEVASNDDDKAEAEIEEKGPAVYHNFKPVFVVNLLPDSRSKVKMLQIDVQALMYSEELMLFLKHNDPMIRHHLLKLFGSRTASELADRKGKEKLQEDVLKELQRIVKDHGSLSGVKAVFFTSFVMQ